MGVNNCEVNRDYLARTIVEAMSREQLMAALSDWLTMGYKHDSTAFEEDWERYCPGLDAAPNT